MLKYVIAIVMVNILFLKPSSGQESEAKIIADLEKKPNYTVKGTSGNRISIE